MVEGGLAEDVEDAAGGAGLGVGGAEDDGGDAGEDDRAGAHRAGLERDVERRRRQPPAAERLGGGADREDLGVGGRVAAQLALVAGGGEHSPSRATTAPIGTSPWRLRLAGTLERQPPSGARRSAVHRGLAASIGEYVRARLRAARRC